MEISERKLRTQSDEAEQIKPIIRGRQCNQIARGLKPESAFCEQTLKLFLNVQSLKPDENNIHFDRTLKMIADTGDRK